MAGLQARALEMYLALQSHDCEVAFLAPSASSGQGPFRTVSNRAQVVHFGPDCWICHPLLLRHFRWCLAVAPMVADCYEAPYGSFLYYAVDSARRGRNGAIQTYRREISEYFAALTVSAWFLVANERQHAALVSVLALLGLIDPADSPAERVLIVSSGVPAGGPSHGRQLHQAGHPIFLWSGGAYPWFAVDQLVGACTEVAARMPGSRFIFAGVHGAADSDGNRQALGALLETAVGQDAELRRRSEFVPWAPYADRHRLYQRADIALCTFGQHLETYFSMRTRLLDYLWARLPIITTGGDALSAMLGRLRAALVVEDHAPALAEAMIALAEDQRVAADQVASAEALASGPLAWRSMVDPLLSLPSSSARIDRPLRGTALFRPTAGQLARRRAAELLARLALRLPAARRRL